MDTTAHAITYLSALVSLGLLVQTVRKLVKEAPATRLAPLVSIGATLVTTLLYILITGAVVNGWLAAALFGLGLVIGCGEGRLTHLYYREHTLTLKRGAGYLIVWGAAYLLTVALDQLGSAALHAVGILILAFGVGTTFGANCVLLVKLITFRPPTATAAPLPTPMPGVPFVVQPPAAVQPAPPGVYPPAAQLPRRRSDSTCLILTILGVLGVLCSLLAVVLVIYTSGQG